MMCPTGVLSRIGLRNCTLEEAAALPAETDWAGVPVARARRGLAVVPGRAATPEVRFSPAPLPARCRVYLAWAQTVPMDTSIPNQRGRFPDVPAGRSGFVTQALDDFAKPLGNRLVQHLLSEAAKLFGLSTERLHMRSFAGMKPQI